MSRAPRRARRRARAGTHRTVVRFAARWSIRSTGTGRPSFPFLRRRRRFPYLVLVYHRVNDDRAAIFPGVPPARFRTQMERLLDHGPVLPLEELIDRARADDVPPGASAVTFDDGYRDNYTCAYPILQSLAVPATIFLATGPLDTRRPLWHDRVFRAFTEASTEAIHVQGEAWAMDGTAERRTALHRFVTLARTLDASEREVLIESLERQTRPGREADHLDEMLRWDDIRVMAAGGITFGAHTVTHPILARSGDSDLAREVQESKEAIERELKRGVRLFAYPNGTEDDFDERTIAALSQAGFEAALTTLWGANDAATDPYRLHRVGFWGTDVIRGSLRLAWTRAAAR